MRRILIEQARRKSAHKRGAGVALEQLQESRIELKATADEFIAIHETIDALQEEDALAAEVVKLRYFVGMKNEEVAGALGISPSTVDRHRAFARAWLKGVIKTHTGDALVVLDTTHSSTPVLRRFLGVATTPLPADKLVEQRTKPKGASRRPQP
jgi:DNA-binding transcriptional regulator YiaG